MKTACLQLAVLIKQLNILDASKNAMASPAQPI